MASLTGDVERLADEILARARAEADAVGVDAQARAAETVSRARADAEAEARRRLAAAEKDAPVIVRRAMSSAEVAAQRRVLEARENLIDQALGLTWRLATALDDPAERRQSLLALVVEAVAALGGGEVTLQLNPRDHALVSPAFLAQTRDLLDRSGIPATLAVIPEPAHIAGGVVAAKAGGRVLFDNSLEARFERQRDSLRDDVWQVLGGGRQ
jgi:vacuolar-type H+-ATPase subunit E/Vma4